MPSFVEILLWMFVTNLGVAVGAGLYEQRVVLPLWFERAPAGVRVNVEAMRGTDPGRRFWGFVTTAPLTLLTLASLALSWRHEGPREQWWLAAAIVVLIERVGTFTFFIPTAIKLMRADELPAQQSAAMAARWMSVNHVRATMSLVGWLLALNALSHPNA